MRALIHLENNNMDLHVELDSMRIHHQIDISPYKGMILKFVKQQFSEAPKWAVHDEDQDCKECDKAFGAGAKFNGVGYQSLVAQLGIVIGIAGRSPERYDKDARDMLRKAAGVFARAFQIEKFKELWPK